MKDFLAGVKKKFKRVVWEPPPAWDADEAQSLASESGAVAARDPLASGTTTGAVRVLPPAGPGRAQEPLRRPGHREARRDRAARRRTSRRRYVFTNVDMFADAKRLKKAMKL